MKISQNQYFRLPWTQEDNPNGWIEPTTYCQLQCPGCYRGIDQESHCAAHLPLEEVKKQVDRLLEERNIHTLSIAGGEPLLYPYLLDLISYASEKGLRIMIYTNGIALDKSLLIRLKEAGTTQVLIHIDKFQGRTSHNTLDELIDLRGQYCDLFREVKGINLGFIQPLTKNCLEDLKVLSDFFTKNRDIISLVVFTLYREIHWQHKLKPGIDTSVTIGEVLDRLEEVKVFRRTAYLPATINTAEPAWVFSYSVGTAKSILGFIDKNVYKHIQKRYYQYRAKFLFISRNYSVRRSSLLKLVYNHRIFRILVKSISFPKKALFFQTYLVIRGPVKNGQQWDLCDGCPDAMYYDGKLEPSCILEEIRATKSI